MTNPITPPPELVKQWFMDQRGLSEASRQHIATRAAQWGADQELEACCGLLVQQGFDLVDYLRAARRPKPPSLKEQALGAMGRFTTNAHTHADEMVRDFDTIRRALEELP